MGVMKKSILTENTKHNYRQELKSKFDNVHSRSTANFNNMNNKVHH